MENELKILQIADKEGDSIVGMSAIIKPTNACNFSCKYCYADSGACRDRMSGETLENSIRKLAYFNGGEESFDRFGKLTSSLVWHGGEPLLVGINFYRRAVEIQKELEKKGYRFKNGIQTNGSLINEETADFFKEQNFSVGLSLDGPKELNDMTRTYRSKKNGNRSAFDDIMSSVELLRKRNINPGVIVVVNKHNINSLDKIYEFLKQNKLDAKFNPLIKSGRAIENYEELTISPQEYAEERLKLFKIWAQDENPIHLDCFEDLIKNILSKGIYTECCFKESCQDKFIAIDSSGDVYPCGEFCGKTEFKYGNVNEKDLKEILSHPLRTKLSERSKNLEECFGCEYRQLCHGGCMYQAYASNGEIMTKDPCCLSNKMLFEYIIKKILPEYSKSERGSNKDGSNN